MKLFNSKRLKLTRKGLRHLMPLAEQRLWSRLRSKQLNDYKFRRQSSVGPYVVDFYCPKAKLVIEIDGDSHFSPDALNYDQQRQKFLEGLELKVLRFTNDEVFGNLESVVERILNELAYLDRS